MKDGDGTLLGHLGFIIRMDQPPPGCRWCRDVEILSDEVARLLEEKKVAPQIPHHVGDPQHMRDTGSVS